jgi:hypothetical protein
LGKKKEIQNFTYKVPIQFAYFYPHLDTEII